MRLLLLAFFLPALASAQTCLCCKKRDSGQAAYDRKDYATALTEWERGLNLSDAAKCPELQNLITQAKVNLNHLKFIQTKDNDEDGTPDMQDDCPDTYGPKQYSGCPDRDFDETPDLKDLCPDQPGPKNTAGCPDRDADAVADKGDQCPDTPGLKAFAGCPDRDGDSIIDANDDCPDTPGLKRFNGCLDKDFDETPDQKDGCPDVRGPKTAYGCPDRDGDGVADKDDQCPDVDPGFTQWGCPEEKMVTIEGGNFIMGDVFNEGEGDEIQHSITISSFRLGKTEVTFDDFDAFCMATGREKPSDSGWGRGQRPVINVDWYDAVEYCNWLSQQQKKMSVYIIDKSHWDANSDTYDTKKWIVTSMPNANGYRLPTEAEWEYAAREGGKKIRFGNGKDIADPMQINFDASAKFKEAYSSVGESRQKTLEVGRPHSPNIFGLHNMSDNVAEWCADRYGPYSSNPTGAVVGANRILRGGAWYYSPKPCRTANRNYGSPTALSNHMGFRIACSPGEQKKGE